MFRRVIWDNLPECIFEKKSWDWFIPKIARTEHVIAGLSHQTNKHFVLKLTADNYKSASGQLQNNTVYGAMSITINCVISYSILLWVDIIQAFLIIFCQDLTKV